MLCLFQCLIYLIHLFIFVWIFIIINNDICQNIIPNRTYVIYILYGEVFRCNYVIFCQCDAIHIKIVDRHQRQLVTNERKKREMKKEKREFKQMKLAIERAKKHIYVQCIWKQIDDVCLCGTWFSGAKTVKFYD